MAFDWTKPAEAVRAGLEAAKQLLSSGFRASKGHPKSSQPALKPM